MLVDHGNRQSLSCGHIFTPLHRRRFFLEATEQKQIEDRNHISIMFHLMFSDSDPTFQEMLEFIAEQMGMPLAPRETSKKTLN